MSESASPPPLEDAELTDDPYSEVFCGRQPPEERSISWKGAKRILSLPDSAIQLISVRSNGVEYYRIEDGTIKWNPKTERFFCGKPGCGVRGDCSHSRRIERFREDSGR